MHQTSEKQRIHLIKFTAAKSTNGTTRRNGASSRGRIKRNEIRFKKLILRDECGAGSFRCGSVLIKYSSAFLAVGFLDNPVIVNRVHGVEKAGFVPPVIWEYPGQYLN